MKISKILSIFLCLCLLCPWLSSGKAAALDEPEIGAGAVYLVETATGQTFYEKNAHEHMYPASLTKIMTILLVVEAVEAGEVALDDQVTAQEDIFFDLESDGSTAGIKVGEVMSLENLIHCALLSSANEACNVLAEYVAGSIAGFIDRMNVRAAELGCEDTQFKNAHGLPNEEHYSTAYDIYLITREAMDHELFERICNTDTVEIPATNLSGMRTLTTTNYLINPNSSRSEYYYEGTSGVKTGYTSAAGYCLVSTVTKNDMNLISVVMGAKSYDADGIRHIGSFEDTITLFNWVFENYYYQDILRSSEIIDNVPISMAVGTDSVPLRPEHTLTALLPADVDLNGFEREVVIYSQRDNEELVAPMNSGTVLGKITVTRDGHVYGTTNLVAAGSVSLSKTQYLRTEIADLTDNTAVVVIFWLLAVLALAYLAWVIIYMIRRRMYVTAMREAGLDPHGRPKAPEDDGVVVPGGRPPHLRLPWKKKEPKAAEETPVAIPDAPPVFTPPTPTEEDLPAPEAAPEAPEPETVTAAAPAEAPAAPQANTRPMDRDYFEEFFKRK